MSNVDVAPDEVQTIYVRLRLASNASQYTTQAGCNSWGQ